MFELVCGLLGYFDGRSGHKRLTGYRFRICIEAIITRRLLAKRAVNTFLSDGSRV